MTDHPSTMDRRAVIKASAVAATTAAAGLPAQALAQARDRRQVRRHPLG